LEHSWGRNIFDVGLGDAGASLCARVLDLPDEWYVTNEQRTFETCMLWRRIADVSGIGGLVPFEAPKRAPGNFPYGYLVLPDVPV